MCFLVEQQWKLIDCGLGQVMWRRNNLVDCLLITFFLWRDIFFSRHYLLDHQATIIKCALLCEKKGMSLKKKRAISWYVLLRERGREEMGWGNNKKWTNLENKGRASVGRDTRPLPHLQHPVLYLSRLQRICHSKIFQFVIQHRLTKAFY